MFRETLLEVLEECYTSGKLYYTIVFLFIFYCRYRSLGHMQELFLYLLCGTGCTCHCNCKNACVCSRNFHILKVYALQCTGYYIQSTQKEVRLSAEMNVWDESGLSAIGLGQPHLFYCGIATAGVPLSLELLLSVYCFEPPLNFCFVYFEQIVRLWLSNLMPAPQQFYTVRGKSAFRRPVCCLITPDTDMTRKPTKHYIFVFIA